MEEQKENVMLTLRLDDEGDVHMNTNVDVPIEALMVILEYAKSKLMAMYITNVAQNKRRNQPLIQPVTVNPTLQRRE